MSEETTQANATGVESRIEAVLFPTEEAPQLEEKPVESEQVALDSEEDQIPDGDQSEDAEAGQEQVEEETPQPDEPEALFQHLGLSEDQLSYDEETGEPVFHAKVGEEDYPVKFKDLVKSYQLEQHINNKSIALSEKQKEFDETYGNFKQEFETKLSQADEAAAVMERQILGEYNEIDWDNLKLTNPTEYAVQRQAFSERAQHIKGIQEAIKSEREETSKRQNEVMQRQFNDFKQQQAELLISAYPHWLDTKVMQKEVNEIRTFAADKYGFTDKELDGIYDSRIIRVLMDAKSLNKAKANVESKAKKDVPKFQKTSSRKGPSKAAQEAKAKRAALRKSGSQTDLTNVLIDRM